MNVYIDGNFVAVAMMLGLAVVFTWLWMSFREAHIHADGWNEGYDHGIEQGLREAAEEAGGPPAPLRIEETAR